MKVEPFEVKQEIEEDVKQETEQDQCDFSESNLILKKNEEKEYGSETIGHMVYKQRERYTNVSDSENEKNLKALYEKHAIKEEIVIGPTEIIDHNGQVVKYDTLKDKPSSPNKICCVFCSQLFKLNVAFNAHKRKCHETLYAQNVALKGTAYYVKPKKKEDKENRTPGDDEEEKNILNNVKLKKDEGKTKTDKEETNTINPNNKKSYACTICKKSFTLKLNLKRHNIAYHSQNSITFKCSDCGKEFIRKDYVYRHMKVCSARNVFYKNKNKSTNEKTYQCVCGKILKDSLSLHQHKEIHCGKTAVCLNLGQEDKRKCSEIVDKIPKTNGECVCGKIIKDPSNLARHKKKYCDILARKSHKSDENIIKVTTSNSKSYTCDYCKKSYAEKRNLIEHIGRYHYKSLHNLKCKFCKQNFTTKRSLMKHQITHNGEGYSCRFCNQVLRSRWGHRTHEKRCKDKQVKSI